MDARAELLEQSGIVRCDDHRAVRRDVLLQETHDRIEALCIEPVVGLVEHEQRWWTDERSYKKEKRDLFFNN